MFDSPCNIIIPLFILFSLCASCEAKPPFNDIGFPQGEKSTYEIREGGTVTCTSHVVSREVRDGKVVYFIRTDSMEMILSPEGMLPISLTKRNKSGKLEFSVKYYKPKNKPKRVRFSYPTERNKEVKISGNSYYDFNTMLEVIRCYPLDRDKIKFKLVVEDRVVGAYAKLVRAEKVCTPFGDFDCCLIEGGISGFIMGKIARKKFLFWVEEKYPHKLVKFKYGKQVVTLIDYNAP